MRAALSDQIAVAADSIDPVLVDMLRTARGAEVAVDALKTYLIAKGYTPTGLDRIVANYADELKAQARALQ